VLFGGYVAELLYVPNRTEREAAETAAQDFDLLKQWGIGEALATAGRRAAQEIVAGNEETMRALALQLFSLVLKSGALSGPLLDERLAKVKTYPWPPAYWPSLGAEGI
jgi:hypothetical protein